MKNIKIKLVALFLTLSLSSCYEYVYLPKGQPYSIIMSVNTTIQDELGTCRYEAHNKCGWQIFFLDELLNIGDTIWVGSKVSIEK